MYRDLDAGPAWGGFLRAAACVADFADGDGGGAEGEFAVLDLEVVFVCGDVFVDGDFGFGGAVVFDFDFEVEGCDTFEGDGYDFFTVLFAGAVAVGFAGVVEASVGAGVDGLDDGHGCEMSRGVVVLGISELNEFILIAASL